MSRSKKIFITICILFFVGVAYFGYDVSSRTTFPGSKSQLKERLKRQYLKTDSAKADSANTIGK
jgi:hypothetical protein